jgi:hypothetical protein
VQSGGHYTYEDRDYSIFNVTIKDSGLLARVLEFILEIRSNINHPELEKIIESISDAISETQHLEESGSEMDEPDDLEIFEQAVEFTAEELTWAGILKIIN